jgi:fumarylacetoacetase
VNPPDHSGDAGDLGEVDLSQVEAYGVDLVDVDLEQADLGLVDLEQVDLALVDLEQVEAYGVGGPVGSEPTVIARFGDRVIDLDRLHSMGLLNVGGLDLHDAVFGGRSLNRFMSLGAPTWRAVDERLSEILSGGAPPEALAPLAETQLVLPVEVADFCDFYASEHHASNMGRILRPGSEPLPTAWKRIPLGYHGRAGTVVVSGTPVRRPNGVSAHPEGPAYGASRRLDLEVELGYVIGVGSTQGEKVPVDEALDHVFGVVVLNDWSARDIQAFEYQPLGPFLGKSFATSISPWVVPMRALNAFRVDGPEQGAEVGGHLACPQPRAFDIIFELSINSTILSRPESRFVHWSVEQLVAHLTSNGASLRTGDLLATGTISGPEIESWGSLMELAWGGERPVVLNDGTERTWLEDGDTLTIRARLDPRPLLATGERSPAIGDNEVSIPLGEVTGKILAAEPDS